MFSKKATKIDEIFPVDLTLCSKCQIDSEDFVDFCGLLRKHELYHQIMSITVVIRYTKKEPKSDDRLSKFDWHDLSTIVLAIMLLHNLKTISETN